MSSVIFVATELERGRLPALERASRVERCGLGPVAAALEVAARLAARPAERALLVGLSGTRDAVLAPVGGVLAGSEAVNEAVGVGDGEGFLDLAGMGLPSEELSPDRLPLTLPVGLNELSSATIGTVAAASADPEHAAARRRRRPEVLLEDMESWAVALACQRFGTPLSVVRAVSNVAGHRDTSAWRFDEAFAALDLAINRWLGATSETP